MKKKIVWIVLAVLLLVFFIFSAKVIDKGTEDQYTGVVAFDAGASSSGDWDNVVAEIMEKAEDIASLDLKALGEGKAVKLTGTVNEYVSKAAGKKNSVIVVPDGYSGDAVISVQLGSIYSGTAVRDVQTMKVFGDFTNQTEWSQYGKALNEQLHELVVTPAGIDENVQGKKITVVGVAVASGKEVTITPVALTVE